MMSAASTRSQPCLKTKAPYSTLPASYSLQLSPGRMRSPAEMDTAVTIGVLFLAALPKSNP